MNISHSTAGLSWEAYSKSVHSQAKDVHLSDMRKTNPAAPFWIHWVTLAFSIRALSIGRWGRGDQSRGRAVQGRSGTRQGARNGPPGSCSTRIPDVVSELSQKATRRVREGGWDRKDSGRSNTLNLLELGCD